MAFCAITKDDKIKLYTIALLKIEKNPSKLKAFKDLTKEVFDFLISKGVPTEKAISMSSHMPNIAFEFARVKENRKLLKDMEISMDAISASEETFEDFKKLSSYLGLTGEQPMHVISTAQVDIAKKIDDLITNTKVEFVDGKRKINGKFYEHRVTNLARAGFIDPEASEDNDSPALKHGNNIDAIGKLVFSNQLSSKDFNKFENDMSHTAYETVVGEFFKIKNNLESEGFTFRSGVTVYDKETGVAGEIDLLAIDKDGKMYIWDFKTAGKRFNASYLKNDKLSYSSINTEVALLPKWNQYGTQGILYAMMLEKMTGSEVEKSMNLIGISINYDNTVPADESKLEKVVEVVTEKIGTSGLRSEYKGKTLSEIVEESNKLNQNFQGTPTEVPETGHKKRSPREIKNFGYNEQKLDRIAMIEEAAATDEELKKEIDWFKSNPIGRNTLINIHNIVNSGLFGKWTLHGITLYKNASKGTVYHEGWHRFSQVFMTRLEKVQLYNDVAKDTISFTSRTGKKLNTASASSLEIEEFLAEEFSKYALNPTEYKYPNEKNDKPKGLFARIWDFLKRYFGSGTQNRPIELFQKLYRGDIKEYRPYINNAIWGSLNSVATNSQGNEIVAPERLPVWVRSMDYLISEELKKAGKSFTAFKESKKLRASVINNVFYRLQDKQIDPELTDEQFNELQNILANGFDFTNIYLSKSSYDSLKDFNVEEELFNLSPEEVGAIEDIMDDFSELYDPNEEEDDSKPERFDRAGNEDSALSLADAAIQDFFRSIPKVTNVREDGSMEYELNELGFPENHKYYDIFYKTKKLLSGKFEMDDMIAEMISPHNQRIFPELKIVAEFIQKFLNNKEEKNYYRKVQNFQFVQAFYNSMVMPEISNTQLTIDYRPLEKNYSTFKTTTVSYKKAARNMSIKIVQGWQQDFKDKRGKTPVTFNNFDQNKSALRNNPYYVTEDGKLMLNPFMNFSKYENFNRPELVSEFMEMMGIKMNSKVYQDVPSMRKLRDVALRLLDNVKKYQSFITPALTGGESMNSLIDTLDNGLLDSLAKGDRTGKNHFERNGFFIDNPIKFFSEIREFELDKSKLKLPTLKYAFDDLAEIEEMFGNKVSSGAFRIEDKTKHPYYLPNQISIVTELLNRVKNTGELANQIYLSHLDPIKAPWMKYSFFMKQLFTEEGNKRLDTNTGKDVRIVLEDIASVKMANKDGIQEFHPRSLSKSEKLFMDALTLFHSGAIEIPRAETSSTIFSVRLSDNGTRYNNYLPFAIGDVQGKGNNYPEKFLSTLKDYFKAEVMKRNWYKENKPKSAFANRFNIFQDILSPELRKVVEDNLQSEDIFNLPFTEGKNVEQQFKDEVTNFFNDAIEKLTVEFAQIKGDRLAILKDVTGANTQSMRTFAKLFAINQFILSSEFYNLYFGDLYFYKNPFKRGKIVTNTGNSMYVDGKRNEMLNDLQGETLHSIMTGTVAPKDFRYIKSATISDVEMKSTYVNEDDNQNRLLVDTINSRIALGALDPNNTEEYKKAVDGIKKQLKNYNKINIADGQGIISLDFYKTFALVAAPQLWTESKEREYQRQKSIFRYNNNLYFKLDNEGNKVELEGQELESAKERDLEMVKHEPFDYFNPLKISYTGAEASEGPMKPVFDKFSVRPIIPEVAKGKRDENLLLEMTAKDYDYIKFESGTKVIQKNDPRFDWFKKVADGQYDLNEYNVSIDHSQSLYSAYLKHQLNTEGIKDENILGSQFRKIVFGVKYLPHVRNNSELFNYFEKQEAAFKKSIEDLISTEENDLFTLLGIEKKKDGTYQVSNMQKFIKLLNEESSKRGIPINNIQYIAYNEDSKTSTYPIDYAFNRVQIIDLLSGLIDERLRRLKVTGSSLIQVSQAGSENKSLKFQKPSREQLEQFGTAGLHYYHMKYDENGQPTRTSTMGVKVALTKDFEKLFNLTHPDGEKMAVGSKNNFTFDYDASLARLNDAMKNTEWKKKNMDSFIMIGYRIPTQNINFIDHMEVMEFLPKSAGNIIIPPVELIIKSGSDFDIDKMNVIKPSFTDSGRIKRVPKETMEEIHQKIRESIYNERDLRGVKSKLGKLMNETDIQWDELLKTQRKIRLTLANYITEYASERLSEKIFQNIKSDDKLESIPNDLVKSDFEDIEDSDENTELSTNKAIQALYTLDREIWKLRDQHNIAKDEKNEVSREMEWFEKKKAFKAGKNNDIIKILSESLSHPVYFEHLVTPSTASMMEELANDMIAAKGDLSTEDKSKKLEENDGKLYDSVKGTAENAMYSSSLETFDNFLGKRKDLGGYAIQRTFSDIFNFINLSIAKSYTDAKGENKVIYTPLIAPSKRTQDRIKMHGDTVKDVFDQLISATVDLASSPFYPYLGINPYNKKHLQFLIHQQVDPKAAIWFLNQPILQQVYELVESKKRDGVKGYTLKHALVEVGLKNKALENPQLENSFRNKYSVYESKWVPAVYDPINEDEIIEDGYIQYDTKKANPFLARPFSDFNNSLTEDDHFTIRELENGIRNKQVNTEFQKKVLSYFASMIEEADMLMKLQFAYNTDTTKYSTLTSIIRNRKNKEEIKRSDLFDNSQIEKLANNSMIAPFDYTTKAGQIYKTLFPKLYTNKTISVFTRLGLDVFGVNNVQMERISKIIENDYIEFVYKNFGTFNGENVSDRFRDKLMNPLDKVEPEFFSDKFIKLKNDYPELDEIPFVKAIYEDKHIPSTEIENSFRGLDNMEIRNLFFARNPDNPVFERDIFTNNWRNLIDFSPEKLGLKGVYSTQDIRNISQFFHELVYFSLFQSGLTNNSNGFSDLIPYEYWGSFIETAFSNMETKFAENKSLEDEYLNLFELRVKQMNPKINFKTKYIQSNEPIDVVMKNGDIKSEYTKEELQMFRNYYRGKDYKIDDFDLFLLSQIKVASNDDLADDKNVEMKDPTKIDTGFKLEVGRYVMYKDEVYIVTKKQKRSDIWRIYNPLKDGPSSNIGVSEKNLVPRDEKGKVVSYGLKQYLVTAKEEIIDMTTYKKVTWSKTDPNRKLILETASNPNSPLDEDGNPKVC